MVVQFVAFLGAYRNPGDLDPWVAAVLGALLTTWVTFVPSFLFIFLGAPYVERLRGNRALGAALTAITAAVVGVIANLALYFTTHTLFGTTSTWTAGLNWHPNPNTRVVFNYIRFSGENSPLYINTLPVAGAGSRTAKGDIFGSRLEFDF